ncbi:hypothetical protein PACTADRAFT_50123 [Pachysolen tannophilus NRRL Y-2460]|uniref:Bacterial surface antigen (D15) domain-containing protein n=1 Tax=Pachysolen tannophilus NRRL Y-2460 TaxID=669874 RepID=A0A1E4TUI1_PACTA|nr:hypothetical protein PACTADRAFT_50123 [Pachysolen tannophilus NRRL Y-2460]
MAGNLINISSSSTTDDILTKNKTRPVYLGKVEINGGEDFSNNFYSKLLTPLLQSSDVTVQQLLNACNRSFDDLSYTGVFQKINFEILEDKLESNVDLPSSFFYKKPDAIKPLPVKAIISLKTRKLSNIGINSIFYDNGNAININYENLNYFGNSEYLLINTLLDLRKNLPTKAINFNFKTPLKAHTSSKFFINGLITDSENKFSSHEQILFSGMVGLEKNNFFKLNKTLYNSLLTTGFSINRRTITNINDSASDIVKNNAGDSLKQSFILSGSIDSRKYLSPETLFPIDGLFIKVDNEISGIYQKDSIDDQFLKSCINFQALKSIFNKKLIFEISSAVGGIASIINYNKSNIHIQDKFFLGGINSLQGFKYNSIGIKDGDDFIGGNAFYKLRFAIMYGLPFINASTTPLRIINYINFGDVLTNFTSLKNKDFSFNKIDDFLKNQTSTSAGIGLIYQYNSTASLNLSYNFPISTRTNDITKPGLDFGLSISGNF